MNQLPRKIFLNFLTISLISNISCTKKEEPKCEELINKTYCDLPVETREQRASKAACEIGSYLTCQKTKGNYREAIQYLNDLDITP